MAEPTKIKSICFEKMYGVLRPLKLNYRIELEYKNRIKNIRIE